MKKIVIHSVTIRAQLVDEANPADTENWQQTFVPEEKDLPGIIKDIFRNASWYILHRVLKERQE